MPSDTERKHKRKSEENSDSHKHKKRRKEVKDGKRKKESHKAITVVDDNAEDEEMWVESNIDVDGQHVRTLVSLSRYFAYIL